VSVAAPWHVRSVAEVARAVESDVERGLSSAEASRRLARDGPNELERRGGPSVWSLAAAQFRGVAVWVLAAAAVASGLLGEWTDAAAILAILVLDAVLGFVQEFRAERALLALRRLAAPTSRVLRDGSPATVPSREVVRGDVLLLDAGDVVPADSRLASAHSLRTLESALTGESVPVEKTTDPIEGEDAERTSVGDRTNVVFAGTSIVAGRGAAVVVATGASTELGRIANLLESAGRDETPLQRRLDRLGIALVWASLAVVALVFALGLVRHVPLLDMALTAVSLAVAAIPEGLPAVVTIALALGVQRMVKRHVLVRRLPAVETLGSTSVICSDKTGTLTQNEMTVRALIVGGREVRVTGEGYATRGEFHVDGSAVDPSTSSDLRRALWIGAACNSASLRRDGGIVGDPTEAALLVAAAKGGIATDAVQAEEPLVEEIPFDSTRKRMTTIRRTKGGDVAYVKGAPESMVPRCIAALEGTTVRPLDAAAAERIRAENARLAARALRVLALAERRLSEPSTRAEDVERDLVFVGLVAMNDPARPEARASVETCRRAGIRTVMITGDHRATAVAIAQDLGILGSGDRAVAGDELERTTDAELERDVDRIAVYARVSPEHKLRIVRAWRRRGAVVAMTGDGVNDAPALKEADIGVAMGLAGTEVSKEASDMILTDDDFSSIVAAVEEGRAIFDSIRKFAFYLLSCNVGEILTMLVASVLGWPLPLLPLQILWVNLVTDGLPALALGVDPAEPGVMERPPRRRDEGILTRRFVGDVLGVGAMIAACALLAFALVLFVEDEGLVRARTAAFTVLSASQLVHSFNCRSERESIFRLGLGTNRSLVVAFGASLALQFAAVTIPPLQRIFDTQPLSALDWASAAALATSPLWIVELSKAWRRRSRRTPQRGAPT
jgi:P-type Ca2+ transporter type 2C